jgi:hypothetical protein
MSEKANQAKITSFPIVVVVIPYNFTFEAKYCHFSSFPRSDLNGIYFDFSTRAQHPTLLINTIHHIAFTAKSRTERNHVALQGHPACQSNCVQHPRGVTLRQHSCNQVRPSWFPMELS